MKIKALRKVPVLFGEKIEHLEPGKSYDVGEEVGEALIRGGDAVKLAEESPAPALSRDAAITEALSSSRGPFRKRGKKNAGAAPMNKNAGSAPEDK